MSFLTNATIAFCGTIDESSKQAILNYLQPFHVRICTLSKEAKFLIVGNDYKEKYKYKLLKKTAQCISYKDILDRIPTIQTELWVDEYKPKTLANVIGHKTQIQSLQSWLENWSDSKNNKDSTNGALITGPPGIGKTTVVHLVIRNAGYNIIEMNASNERSAKAVKQWFEEASQSHFVGKRRVIVMDEVDGMSSGDRGGLKELAKIIRTCKFPILCIANERTPKLKPITSCCVDIRFPRPTKSTIAKALYATVVQDKKLNLPISDLETLCERNGNDIRSILNFLQFATCATGASKGVSTKDEIQRMDIFSAAGRLFVKNLPLEYRMNLVFLDFSMVPLMVQEGYIGASAKGPGTDDDRMKRCALAADRICDWDILDTRIRKTQNWSLLPSATIPILDAGSLVEGPAPFQIFPSWLGKNSKRLKHMRNLRTMRGQGVYSSFEMVDRMDLMRLCLYDPTCAVTDVIERLRSFHLTRDDMFDTLADLVFPGSEHTVKMDTKRKGAITREWKRQYNRIDDIQKKTSGEESDDEDTYTDDELDIDLL